MDRERLAHLLNTPAEAARSDVDGLQALTERSPWFSAAHLLRAMAEHASGDVLMDDTVRTAAAHLPSRALLFDRVHPALVSRATAPLEEQPPPAPAEITALPSPSNLHGEPPVPEPDASTPGPSSTIGPLPFSPASLTAVVEHEDDRQEEMGDQPAPTIGIPPDEPNFDIAERLLEQQIIESALVSGYALTWEHPAPETTPPPREEPPVLQVAASEDPVDRLSPAHVAKRRFTDWLSEPATPPLPPPSEPMAKAMAAPAAPPSATGPAASPTDARTIIDRFIHQQTPEPRPKAEFFSPQQAGKRSLEEYAELVTETLARIYEQQGNLAKAIAAYEKLALKVPAKSAYFAARIQELRSRTAK